MRTKILAGLVASVLVGAIAGAPSSSAQIGPPAPETAPGGGAWLAGDLHVHTPYSHDSYGGPDDDNTGPEEAYLLGNTVQGNFLSAAVRGLDYLAITDHNDVRSQSDPGFATSGVIGLPGYENSLNGHAQMLGATKIYDSGDKGVAAVTKMADELRADGGAFQVNHPAEGATDYPHEVDWAYRYDVVPNTVEVWNISRLWQPPLPSASSNDDAVRYWEGWLDRGYRIAATGGSDSHYIWTSNLLLGSPTTYVYATDNSVEGILEGLRAGRTFISHQPPTLNGPRLYLEGDGDANGDYESMVGDAVVPGSPMRVRVEGAPGSFLRVITNEGRLAFAPVPVTSPSFEHRFVMPQDSTWVRAELFDPDLAEERKAACDEPFGGETTYCRNMLGILGMTSAMFFEEQKIPTSLTYAGQTQPWGNRFFAAAILRDADGNPLAGQPITFEVMGQEYTATTGRNGLAVRLVSVPGHGQTETVTARFAGTDEYEASETTREVRWGRGR